ncbi:Ig-like domain-containing protein [Cohnella massiliensis]|uniref:Ig-like domain-containing protein n=1 Tax=Cohnella massiliensis TaxID=1816691 RepID=UPI0009BC0CA2|nr:SwmB domain-containing protein [Cohnella massiliensis]
MPGSRKLSWLLVIALIAQTFASAGASAASSGAEVRIAAAGGPVVTSLFPADDASSVPSNTKLRIQFDEPVKAGSGEIEIKNSATFETVAKYNVAANSPNIQYNYNATAVTITPDANLLAGGSGYYVIVPAGAFTNGAGAPFAGITDPLSWNFQIGGWDTAAPTVLTYAPAPNGVANSLGTNLSLKFNEAVIPGPGNIIVKDLSNGTDTVIPANSDRVSGAGTDTITISPGTFAANMVYAVQIGDNALSDAAGNFYPGIAANDTTTWRFTVTKDTNVPELVSVSPASGVNYVKETEVLKMTFNKPVQGANGQKGTALLDGGTDHVPLTIGVDPSNPNALTLTPDTPFRQASKYVVQIPADAVTDLSGNYFPGILNNHRWTFQTVGSDKIAPGLSSAKIEGANILLTYNEDLDETSVPYASNYYVVVNDVPRQVNGVAVSGKEVRLVLQSGVTVGQTVKLSYTIGDRPLRDKSGNNAAALNGQAVSNTTDTTLPKPVSGTVSGTTLTLTFNKSLSAATTPSASQFAVSVGGSARGVSGVSISGANVILSLGFSIGNGEAAAVSYAPGTAPLVDLSGNAVAAFTSFYVQNATDTVPPTLVSGTASGSVVKLVFSEGLNPSRVPLKSSFSVLVNGTAATVSSVAIANNTVELTLSRALSANQQVQVTYVPGSPAIADLAGNPAGTISAYQIIVGSATAGGATLSSLVLNGTTLTLTYSSALNASVVPNALQYVVQTNGNNITVRSVAVSGQTVTLTLASAIPSGQAVTLTYFNSGVSLQDANGNKMEGFSNRTVTNESSSIPNAPDYLNSDGEGGLLLGLSAASTASSTTASGKSGNRYMIDADKMITSLAMLKSSTTQVTAQQLTFKVPDTETAGMVGLPLRGLISGASMNSGASFRVVHGNLIYTIPLNAIDFNQELSLIGGDVSSAYLYLTMEQTANSSLAAAIGNRTATPQATAAAFSMVVVSGGNQREVSNYNAGGSVKKTFALGSASALPSETAVVRWDDQYGDAVYAPTSIESSANGVRVSTEAKENGTFAVVGKTNRIFSDMNSHWARNDVAILASKFIVDGPTRTTFAPAQNITRAEFAKFIARGLGLPGDRSAAAKFGDVGANGANAAYIGAVSNVGIVQGTEKGTFNPNASITREEMATMMLRAMTYAGVQPSSSANTLSRFTDGNAVSNWARSAVAGNVEAGVMNGVSATKFQPKSNASRAEAAAMVKRMLEYAELLES